MKPSKNILYPGITVALLIGFILLSSWKTAQVNQVTVQQDTTKKSSDKKKSGKYSRKSVITLDERGEPREVITEDFEGDEGLREMMRGNMHFDFDFPPIPDFEGLDMPDFSDVPFPPMMPGFYDLDTTDFKKFYLLGEEFENFDKDFSEMMAMRLDGFGPEFEADMERMREQLEKMDFEFDHQLNGLNGDLQEEMEMLNETLERDLGNLDEQLKQNFHFDSWTDSMKEFENEAQKELVKDGYLEPGDKIESISLEDDEIKINGQVIKEEHAKKYRELHEKYMKRNKFRGRPE